METVVHTTYAILICGLAALVIVHYFEKYED